MTVAPSPHPHRVVITAAGIVSPLGLGLCETLDALRHARSGIGPVYHFDASGCRSQVAGQVDETALADDPRQKKCRSARQHRSGAMWLAAMTEALEADPRFSPELAVVGTTSGGMSFGEAFFRSLQEESPKDEYRRGAARLAHYAPQKAVIDALDTFGFRTPVQIVANACASGTNAIGHAFELIRNGRRSSILCGGYDAISEMVFIGFDSLQASTPEVCAPFDRNRTGLAMGEGAAVLTLEALESALDRGAPILGEITGYGLSTDNYHLTQPHPSGIGPRLAMQRAMASARRAPRQIDYINAHGTATPFNDATEGAAIEELFGKNGVPVSSTKALMGHSLGAAGAVEAVFSLLALHHQFLPPNANYREPDPQWSLDIVANEPRYQRVQTVMSNSFGFGGTNASLILESYRDGGGR
ncbi:MAG TPA: beta-ketoacyl-[acyl-carrier-protein] synthase family protein [Chthoniobacteraceae bacterium]|nr:beta-ketoacyl-[acyl-carrier-protein] synthase family protein [Chthoniobacteraceae bacterium]